MIFEDERAAPGRPARLRPPPRRLHLRGRRISRGGEDPLRPHDLRGRAHSRRRQGRQLPLPADARRLSRRLQRLSRTIPTCRTRARAGRSSAMWDNHEFSWQGWQSIQQAGGTPRPGQSIKVAANQAWFEYLPSRVQEVRAAHRWSSSKRPRSRTSQIEKWDENGLGDEPNNLDRDQQPDRLPRASLRQAPRPDHHRPAQLSQPRPVQRRLARQAGRLGSLRRHVPRGRCSRSSTAAAPSTAAIRPPNSRSGTRAFRTRRRTRRRRRSSAPSRRPGSRTSCASRRRRGRSGAIPTARSTERVDPQNLPAGI